MSGRDAPGMMPKSLKRFRAAVMLQVNGIDHVYDLDAVPKIINVIVAAGL
jgi:hypothetical protein